MKGSDGDSFEPVFVNELLIGIGESFDIELPMDEDTIILRFVIISIGLNSANNDIFVILSHSPLIY